VVALDEVLAAAIDLYGPLAEANGIALATDAVPVTVHGERDLLLQAVCNLIDNAVKFSPPQGRIIIALGTTGGHVKLSIEDQGEGIDAIDRTRIFERFYRGRNAGRTDGCGLGLSLVRAICVHHNAEINLFDAAPGLRVEVRFNALNVPDTDGSAYHGTGQ
jgi:signal transduction histidine kinase